MKGLVLAEVAHVMSVLAPIDISGGKTTQTVDMKNYGHVTFVLPVGVSAAAFTKILVEQCTAADGTGATAIPFNIYTQEVAGASHDVLSARTAVTAAGFTPSAADAIYYVVEVDASELADGSPFVRLNLTNTTNSVIAAVVAIASGARYAQTQSPTAAA